MAPPALGVPHGLTRRLPHRFRATLNALPPSSLDGCQVMVRTDTMEPSSGPEIRSHPSMLAGLASRLLAD
jgi:hypothetical protein